MEREKLNIEPTQMQVVDRNKTNFVPIEHVVMDSLYFDNLYQKMVFIQLKRFANWHTQEAFPSRATLAQLCYCSEAKIKTTIKELEAKKLIEVKERFEGKKQLSNLYVILEYPYELHDLHYKNEGGHTVAPSGSHGSPVGVTSLPPRGHTVATKEIDIKEKDFKEKKLKNDDDVLRSHYFSTQEYFLLEQRLNDNGFTDKQIIAIKNKFASEKQSWQIKDIVIDMAIALYLEGKEKTKVGSIPAFFYYQFEKAFNDFKVNGRQRQKQYEEYQKQQSTDTVPFYNWLEQ
jgi:Helix-turn-helix domain